MALLSEVQERAWATDKYGDNILRWRWDWRDTRIMAWINNFEKISRQNVMANYERLGIGAYHDHQKKKKTPHQLKRSLKWRTWAASGGDSQVFEARYIYYAKYVELALGRGDTYIQPPDIPHRQWGPIRMPDGRMRKARPFVVAEMRSQAQKFAAFARKEFSFVGTMFLIYAMGNNKSAAAAYNRAVFWAAKKDTYQR